MLNHNFKEPDCNHPLYDLIVAKLIKDALKESNPERISKKEIRQWLRSLL